MKERMILFDLDGTLIDSTEAILESFAHAYRTLGGLAPKEGDIVAMIGQPLEAMFVKLGVEKELVEHYVKAYKEHYRKISCLKTHLLPRAKEAVREAYEFARLGVVTTKTGRYSIELLEYLEIMDYFEVLVGSEDVAAHKPHPEPIYKALALMKHDGKECWMVGDTPMDIEAAQAAGVCACALSCGYASKALLRKYKIPIFPDALSAVRYIKGTSKKVPIIESLL